MENEPLNLIDENWKPTPSNVAALVSGLKDQDDWSEEGEEFDLGGGWNFKLEESFGGTEGGGETYWVVFSLKKGEETTYWKINGFYQSSYGRELDGTPYKVKAVEEKVIVWKKDK